jgi:hypothetical protein
MKTKTKNYFKINNLARAKKDDNSLLTHGFSTFFGNGRQEMMVFDCTTSAIRLSRKNFSFGWNVIYCRQVCNAAAAAATVYTLCSTD